MLDQIIQNSRVLFPKGLNLPMYDHFNSLIELGIKVHPNVPKPKIKICYSLNRLCETFKLNGEKYIVYDQYLGQTFNKLNRILHFEDDTESFAYLCKIMSEEYFIINNYEKSLAYNIYYQMHSNAMASDLSSDFFSLKQEMVLIQEAFVLFHEFAHSIIDEDFTAIENAREFLNSQENDKFLIDFISNHLRENNKSLDEIKYFFEEVACDFLATNFTYVFFKFSAKVNHVNILESISSAFLHLRTIYDVRRKAQKKYFKSESTFIFFMKLRYNALRSYFKIYPEYNSIAGNLVDIYENWEKKFDMNLVSCLNNDFESKLLEIFKGKEMSRNEAMKLLKIV